MRIQGKMKSNIQTSLKILFCFLTTFQKVCKQNEVDSVKELLHHMAEWLCAFNGTKKGVWAN